PGVSRAEKYRKLDFAIESLSRSKDQLAGVDRTNQRYYGLTMLFLGEAYLKRDRPKEAAEQFAASMEVTKRCVGHQHYKVPYVAHQFGVALWRLGQVEKGKATFDEVMAAIERRYGKGHYIYANALLYY